MMAKEKNLHFKSLSKSNEGDLFSEPLPFQRANIFFSRGAWVEQLHRAGGGMAGGLQGRRQKKNRTRGGETTSCIGAAEQKPEGTDVINSLFEL